MNTTAQARHDDLVALHDQGKLSQDVVKTMAKEDRERYNLYRYNRSAMIFNIIQMEKEMSKDSPRGEKIVKLRRRVATFAKLAKQYM